MKRIQRFTLAVTIAVVLAVVTTQVVRADGFYNCTYFEGWPVNCYWIDLDLMSADANSFGFEAMYRLCQMLGLCP